MIRISLADPAAIVVPWEDGLLFERGGKTMRSSLGCKSDQLYFLAKMLQGGGQLSDILLIAANHRPGARKLLGTIRLAVRSGFLRARRQLPVQPVPASLPPALAALRGAEGVFFYDAQHSAWQGMGSLQKKIVGRQHLLAAFRCGADTLLISIPRGASFCLECAFRWLVGNSPAFTESLARLRHYGASPADTMAQADYLDGERDRQFLAGFGAQLDQPAIALLPSNGTSPQSHHALTAHPSCSQAKRHLPVSRLEQAPAALADLAAYLQRNFIGPCHPVHSFSMNSATVGDTTSYLAKATVNSAYRSGVARPLTCFGDGGNAALATVRCIAEAIERFTLMHYSKHGWITRTASQLGGTLAAACSLAWYSDEQYASRGFVYEPTNASQMREWAPCIDLYTKKTAWIWPELVFPTYQAEGRKPTVASSSTGAAVHTTLTDALVNAALEVIERDALALYFYAKLRPIEIDRDSLSSAQAAQIACLADAGFVVLVLLLERDVAVPTVLILATRSNKNPYFLKGASAAMTVGDACERAMREVWRSFVLYEHMGVTPPLPGQVAPTSTEYNLAEYQVPNVLEKLGALARPLQKRSLKASSTGSWTWEAIVAHLHDMGMQAVYVDCATDIVRRHGLFAVKVIISGMVPVSFALQPTCLGLERIYELPRRLGQLDRRLTGVDINQAVHFFS